MFVSEDLVAFCSFARVAIVIDFVFHLTFFVAVLSVDVRRMDLDDFLGRAASAQAGRRGSQPKRQTWLSALLQQKVPFTTRMAGNAVLVCFMLLLNQHFLDENSKTWSIANVWRAWRLQRTNADQLALAPPPINSPRSPLAWLRLQEPQTTKELMQWVGPKRHSVVFRVYEPLTVVLHGSDRTGLPGYTSSLMGVIRDISEEHLFSFIMAFVFSIAIVTLLLNYLLWNELSEDDEDVVEKADPPLFVQSPPRTHTLDVIMLCGSRKGYFVSAGLDRVTTVYILDPQSNTYAQHLLRQANSTTLWPVTAMSFDESSTSFALFAAKDTVSVFSLPDLTLKKTFRMDLFGQTPILYSIVTINGQEQDDLTLISVTPDGQLHTAKFRDDPQMVVVPISASPLACASLIRNDDSGLEILSLARNGELHVSVYSSGNWSTNLYEPRQQDAIETFPKIKYIRAVPVLSLLVVTRPRNVAIVDNKLRVLHSFEVGPASYPSVRVMHSSRRSCPACNSSAVHSLSIIFNGPNSEECLVRTFTADGDTPSSAICLGYRSGENHAGCLGLEKAIVTNHSVYQPGAWETTDVQSIVGIRKPPIASDPVLASFAIKQSAQSASSSTSKGLDSRSRRMQFGKIPETPSEVPQEGDDWEAWTMTSTGEFHTTPLNPRERRGSSSTDPVLSLDDDDDQDQLFVSRPGPITRLGSRSVAVGFGNTIKIITVGSERLGQAAPEFHFTAPPSATSRRRSPRSQR